MGRGRLRRARAARRRRPGRPRRRRRDCRCAIGRAVPPGELLGAADERGGHQAGGPDLAVLLARPAGQRRRAEALARRRAGARHQHAERCDAELCRPADLRRRGRSSAGALEADPGRARRGGGAGSARPAATASAAGWGRRAGMAGGCCPDGQRRALRRRLPAPPRARARGQAAPDLRRRQLPAARARQGRPARPDPRRCDDQGRHGRQGLRRPVRSRPQRNRFDPRMGVDIVSPEGLPHGR